MERFLKEYGFLAPALVFIQMFTTVQPARAQADPVLARGLSHTMEGRAWTEHAIGQANLFLSAPSHHLTASWHERPHSRRTAEGVLVYLIAAPETLASTP